MPTGINMPWYAGNLHCHSTLSDGDTDPKNVAKWYREHGYSFLCLSDHNCLTPIDEYTSNDPDFIGIPGSEYTCQGEGIQTHVNGFGLQEKIPLPEGDLSVVESLQLGIDGILQQGGLAMINHPCWLWSFGSEEMKRLKGAKLFEVFNGGITSNNGGDNRHESTDQIWDALLTEGIEIFGVASDDAHHYEDIGVSPKGFRDAPGTGWVWVQAEELNCEAILESISNGNFIASNGVKLSRLERLPEKLSIEIDHQGAKRMSYSTSFIGREGEVLSVQEGLTPSYEARGGEGYVRARIESSSGTFGWVQPIFPD
jgi:hypothetical protein